MNDQGWQGDDRVRGLLQLVQPLFPQQLHHQVYLVGGCVRDSLIGTAGQDLDLVTALPPEALKQLGFRLVCGRSTLPIWFRCDDRIGTLEAVALSGPDGLEDDLRRRDFTVNAMALSLDGRLIDPFGGRQDLKQRVLRTCTERSFDEDPLRVIRAFRFEAQAWKLTEESERQIANGTWHEALRLIPVERFSRELQKALAAANPSRFFERLLQYGVGRQWLPELFMMSAIPAGPLRHHPEGDLLTHTLQVLQRVTAMTGDPLARFCALCHDIGKLGTDPACYPSHHGHDKDGFQRVEMVCRRLRLPKAWCQAAAWTSRLHTKAGRMEELRTATLLKLAEQAIKAGIAEILPVVVAADSLAQRDGQPLWDRAVSVARLSVTALGVDPERLAALLPAKRSSYLLHKRVERLRALQALECGA